MAAIGNTKAPDVEKRKAFELIVSFPICLGLLIAKYIYCWSVGMSISTTSTILDVLQPTSVNWYNLLRVEYSAKVLRLPQAEEMLGGAGQMVEINKSLMIKRKYQCGGVH